MLNYYFAILLAVSPFLPLLTGPLRVDQIAPFVAFIIFFPRISRAYSPCFTKAIISSLSLLLIAFVSTLTPPYTGELSFGYIDNCLAFIVGPFATYLSIHHLTTYQISRFRLPGLLFCLIIIAALLSISTSLFNSASLLSYFTPPIDSRGISVSELSFSAARYTGIFNSPHAAGQFTFISLLYISNYFIYLSCITRPSAQLQVELFLSFSILLYTAYLAKTKVILFGIPLLLFSYTANSIRSAILTGKARRLQSIILASILFLLIPLSILSLTSLSIPYLFEILFLTRFGHGSLLESLDISAIRYLLFGFGFYKADTLPLFDIGFLEFFQFGGLIGVFLLLYSYYCVFQGLRKYFKRSLLVAFHVVQTIPYKRLINSIHFYENSVFILLSFSFVSLLGGPSITSSRLSVLYPLVLFLLLKFRQTSLLLINHSK